MSYAQRLNKHALIATGLAAVGGPYVFLTNTTASVGVIMVHLLAMWVLVPPLVALADTRTAGAARVTALGLRLVRVWTALVFAGAGMLLIVRQGTGMAWSELVGPALGSALVPVFSWYSLIVVYEAWQERRMLTLRLEADRARAAWTALVARIQPHFLFNSLSSLEQLTLADPPAAAAFVRSLASLYRRILAGSERRLVPLVDELQLARDYLHIQQTRFGARLRPTITSPPDLTGLMVPPTILLTLLENAVTHGVEANPAVTGVALTVTREAAAIVLEVVNDLPADDAAARKNGNGYGQRDVSERLRLVYGDTARMDFVVSTTPSGARQATARVLIPEAAP